MKRKSAIEAAAERAGTEKREAAAAARKSAMEAAKLDTNKKRAGSASALAELIGGVSRQVVEHWIKSGRVPAHRVPVVAKATGLSYHQLNPSVFPADNEMDRAGAK